jgi:hypothetical protein
VGIFLKNLNNFPRVGFGDGLQVEFHYARGKHGDIFSVWLWEKNGPILQGPLEMRVW